MLLRLIISSLPAHTTYATATTGVAACAINGTTLNHFAGIGRGSAGGSDGSSERGRGSSNQLDGSRSRAAVVASVLRNHQACARWRGARVLVVDEVSMLSRHVFEEVEELARAVRGNRCAALRSARRDATRRLARRRCTELA